MAVVKTLFRGLWRVARRIDNTVPPGPALVAALATVPLPFGRPEGPLTARAVLKHSFRAASRYQPGPDVDELVELGFKALRIANQRAQVIASEPGTLSQLLQGGKPSSVQFSAGHVIQHKLYGYRAAIIGWHESCQASAEWQRNNGISTPSQPFYLCLVDVRNRREAQVSYVAQENILLLTDTLCPQNMVREEQAKAELKAAALPGGAAVSSGLTRAPLPQPLPRPSTSQPAAAPKAPQHRFGPADRIVLHPLITQYFLEYRPGEGYYVPSQKLSMSYPFDVPAFAADAVARAAGQALVTTPPPLEGPGPRPVEAAPFALSGSD